MPNLLLLTLFSISWIANAQNTFLSVQHSTKPLIFTDGVDIQSSIQETYNLKTKVQASVSSLDCISCVANSYLWDQSSKTCSDQISQNQAINICTTPAAAKIDTVTSSSNFVNGNYTSSGIQISDTPDAQVIHFSNELKDKVNMVIYCNPSLICYYETQPDKNVASTATKITQVTQELPPGWLGIFIFVPNLRDANIQFPIMQTWSFTIQSIPQAQDCISCMYVNTANWWSSLGCTSQQILSQPGSINSVTACVKNGFLPALKNSLDLSASQSFSNGALQSQVYSFTSPQNPDMMLNLTNLFDKGLTISVTFGSDLSATYASGPVSSSQFTTYRSGTILSLNQNSVEYLIFYAPSGFQEITLNANVSSSAQDCITCVVQSYFWNQATNCSPSIYVPASTQSSISDCLSANLYSNYQSYSISSDKADFQAGQASVNLITLTPDIDDYVLIIQNGFYKSVNFTLTFNQQAVNGWGANVFANASVDSFFKQLTFQPYAGQSVQTLREKGSAFVLVLNTSNPAAYNVIVNVTLSSVANDCITCVANSMGQRMWSQQTLCSPAEQSAVNNYKTINQCLQNQLVPIAQDNFVISQYLSFVSGTFSKQQYSLPGGKNQDMLVIVDNKFAEKVILSLSFGSELTTWYGAGTVGSPDINALIQQSSFNQTLAPYEQGVLVLYSNSSTQQPIDIVVTLTSTAIDCISCVAVKDVWNTNSLCTTVLNETTVNVYNVDGCLQSNQLPPVLYQKTLVVDETLTFNVGVSVPISYAFNSQDRTDMILFLKNGLAKQININLTFADGPQVWNGTTGLPPNIFNGIQTSSFLPGSSISLQNKGDQAVLVFYAAPGLEYPISLTASLSRGIYDCIICVANSMVWNQNLFCSAQKVQDPSELTIGQCVKTNQLPDIQFQKTLIVNGSLAYDKGYATVTDPQFTLKASDSQDMIIYVKNDMGKPLTIWMTSFTDALQVYYVDPVTQNSTKYLENTGIMIQANVQGIFVLYAAANTFTPKFKIKLSQGAGDCVQCVAINTVTPNTMFWSRDTFCSTSTSPLNTIISCLEENLIPEQHQIITVGQSLAFNQGLHQSSYDLILGSSTDMYIKLINAFQKPFNFTISPCPQAGLILQSAIADNQDLALPLLKQMNCGENYTVPTGDIALLVAVATSGINKINLDVRLSTLAPDCISCTQKYLWNPDTFCSNFVGNITSPQQCIQDRQFLYKQGSSGSQDTIILSPSLGFIAGFTSQNYNVVEGYGNVLTLTNQFEQQVDISLGCISPGIQIWYSNYSDPNAQQTPVNAYCNGGSMKLQPKQSAVIVFLAQQATNVNISLSLSSKFSNCVSCVSMSLYWSNSTLCSGSKQSDSYTTVQQCVTGGNQPSNQQSIPLDYGVNFVNAQFKQELALATSNDPQDLMIIVTNSLQKQVNMTLSCNTQFSTWLGVGINQVNAQAVLNTFGCNQVVTLSSQQTLVLVGYSSLSTTFNLIFKVSSLANGCISCISQSYYWSQNFLCSQPTGQVSSQNLQAMGFYNTVQYCISNNLLPQYQQLVMINQRTAIVNGQFSQQFQLTPQQPELTIKLFDSALQNFKVLLNCNQGSLSAWFGSSPNINTVNLNTTQCGQFFTLTTNQSWYLIIAGQQASFTLNLTVVNPVDCTTCVSQNNYWQNNSLCSNTLYAGSLRNIYECIIRNQMSQPKIIALPSNITAPMTYSYTIDQINDDFYLQIPNNSSQTIEMNLACSASNYMQVYALQGTGTNVSTYYQVILVCNSKVQAAVGKQTNIVVYGSTSASVNLTITAVVASESLKLCFAAFGVLLSFVIFIF